MKFIRLLFFSYWFSWERTRHLCQLRRRYVQLYATLLQQASNVDISEIRKIEKILDTKVIILWRCSTAICIDVLLLLLFLNLSHSSSGYDIIYTFRLLGHAKVETVKSKETLHKKGSSKRRWWPFGWFVKQIENEPCSYIIHCLCFVDTSCLVTTSN